MPYSIYYYQCCHGNKCRLDMEINWTNERLGKENRVFLVSRLRKLSQFSHNARHDNIYNIKHLSPTNPFHLFPFSKFTSFNLLSRRCLAEEDPVLTMTACANWCRTAVTKKSAVTTGSLSATNHSFHPMKNVRRRLKWENFLDLTISVVGSVSATSGCVKSTVNAEVDVAVDSGPVSTHITPT